MAAGGMIMGDGMSDKPAVPVPQYTLFEAVGTCLALGRRALEEVRALARLPGPDGRRGQKGEPGTLPVAREWAPGIVHYAGVVVTHGGGTWQASCDTGQAPGHADWVCLARPGIDAAIPKVRGTWSDAEVYAALDIVALGGSSFIARREAPGPCPGEGWQLIASAGRQGSKGPPGERGEAGAAGARGLPGASAPVIIGWKIDRKAYAAIPIMSDKSEAPPLEL